MRQSDVNNKNYVALDTYELDKVIKEHQKNLMSLSLPAFIEFEKKHIKNVFDLFKEDKNNSKLLNQSLMMNPYVGIYKIPLHYNLEIKPEKQTVKEVNVLVYPNYLATGKLRIDFLQSDTYGNFLQSATVKNKSFTLFSAIQNTYSKNNHLDFALIEKRMTTAIRQMLCTQILILK